jgi:hypothetical protein
MAFFYIYNPPPHNAKLIAPSYPRERKDKGEYMMDLPKLTPRKPETPALKVIQ